MLQLKLNQVKEDGTSKYYSPRIFRRATKYWHSKTRGDIHVSYMHPAHMRNAILMIEEQVDAEMQRIKRISPAFYTMLSEGSLDQRAAILCPQYTVLKAEESYRLSMMERAGALPSEPTPETKTETTDMKEPELVQLLSLLDNGPLSVTEWLAATNFSYSAFLKKLQWLEDNHYAGYNDETGKWEKIHFAESAAEDSDLDRLDNQLYTLELFLRDGNQLSTEELEASAFTAGVIDSPEDCRELLRQAVLENKVSFDVSTKKWRLRQQNVKVNVPVEDASLALSRKKLEKALEKAGSNAADQILIERYIASLKEQKTPTVRPALGIGDVSIRAILERHGIVKDEDLLILDPRQVLAFGEVRSVKAVLYIFNACIAQARYTGATWGATSDKSKALEVWRNLEAYDFSNRQVGPKARLNGSLKDRAARILANLSTGNADATAEDVRFILERRRDLEERLSKDKLSLNSAEQATNEHQVYRLSFMSNIGRGITQAFQITN